MVHRFEQFSLAIFEISRCWHKIAAEEMEKYGLRGPYATYLTTLYRQKESVSASRLGALCGKDKADVSRAVAVMEQKDLIKRESVGPNLYRAQLVLTESGMAAARQVCEKAAKVVEFAGRELSLEQREAFYQALEQIAERLQQVSRDGLPQEQDS